MRTRGALDVCLVGVFPLYQYRLYNRNDLKNPSLLDHEFSPKLEIL